jgi:hypothetical protein
MGVGAGLQRLATVDREGRGRIVERRFHADGAAAGESELRFYWP